jgi:phytoene dehydrogenase-like protein
MTVQLGGDTYDFWKKAREENRYAEEKQKTAEAVIAALSARIPEMRGKVEVCDVATPLTYERYCANWKGSWMTEMTKGMKMKTYPAAIKGLSGVYFAGHRMMPPGGLPVALMSGRTAVQYLCRDTNTLFVSET